MRIIPAIDIIDGKCVRLTQGDYAQKKIYNEDPLAVAKSFENAGIKYLHLVDLDGAKAGAVKNWAVVKAITSATKLQVDFGGGIKKEDDITKLLDHGVKQVNLGSIAVKDPKLVFHWISKFGADKIILSADVKNELVQISGWLESASITIEDFVKDFEQHGIRYITCTDISTDGMLSGPNEALYQKLVKRFPGIQWIASGGVSAVSDLEKLKTLGMDGVIIGKAIYEGKIKLEELTKF
ncbi:1-(5-phosphoribosyl)-5-[(5-phosphoribosylamino)methylideneamino]imidazole-4-carboxamide isomerase [Fulvivirgaceae bacterium PWU4]|uniref:1-(5-phosphoribosyl)-5-[(5-phosphoribosylamino)methylideneamino] imidazole-4-carboxamide isomerase n=1 Tax=Chryseosolibacter histidini TaxID=2782349 RepID=A0AAP2DTJ7_9BACT|nr:1-(5-phosphoribosyl)-5-[(5-phosphoribosylamino)methylideneamino]imidazole-4-carboxamide isomerase [Chryseosolibacter histidini]MBT1700722.1 1-(5-phosphoribosyl)-5-[(5-phosphoribosylamino)methylideneamino]imidazole-4-carboxamide isomerase [Chryseosolibacter histidini]